MNKKLFGQLLLVFIVITAIWIGPRIQEDLAKIELGSVRTNMDYKPEQIKKQIVSRVIDGDTIELTSGEKIRYIGMNTPETKDPRRAVECFGKEAFEYNKWLVEGKEVQLERDVSDKDKYGRLLRYVWSNGLLVNEELVKQGYASIATYQPDVRYIERLLIAERHAKENRLGLWEKCKK